METNVIQTELEKRRMQLRERVYQDYAELQEAIDSLNRVVRQRTDLRRAMLRRPMLWIGGAALLGFALGIRSSRTTRFIQSYRSTL